MSFATKAADFAQRTVVCGLLSFFGFQVYQIFTQARRGVVDSPYLESTYFKDVENKVKEELEKQDTVHSAKMRDMYQEDDDSYLKEQVRPNILRPEFKKEYKERKE
jgi:hypothetical protein